MTTDQVHDLIRQRHENERAKAKVAHRRHSGLTTTGDLRKRKYRRTVHRDLVTLAHEWTFHGARKPGR